PDDGGFGMTSEQLCKLYLLVRLLSRLRKRHVDVVGEDGDETDLSGEAEQSIEGGIQETGRLARDLSRHELLVDGPLTAPRKHAGEGRQLAPHMIGGVHVGRV